MYVILAAVLLAAAFGLLSHIYRRNWNKKLGVAIRVSNNGIFEGEQSEISEVITNVKPLPVFWAYIQFRVPGALHFDGMEPGRDSYRQDRVSVLPYEEVTKKLRFTAARRGCYRLDDLQFVAGDLRFRDKMMKSFPGSSEICIYPRAKEIARFRIDSEKIVGEIIAQRSFVEDPFFFRGIRDYYPFDSMKNVNWKATARTGSLKVNEFHTTQSQQVMLLVDLDGYNHLDGWQIKEDVIAVAAFFARKLALNGISVGFVTNAADTVSGKRITSECRSGQSHFLFLMREMAKINTEDLLTPFGNILESLPRNEAKTQYLLISYYYSDAFARQVGAFRSNIRWIFLHDKRRRIDFTRLPNMEICEEVQ